ncbi:unnamed protein product [Ascophyllum nodosum]
MKDTTVYGGLHFGSRALIPCHWLDGIMHGENMFPTWSHVMKLFLSHSTTYQQSTSECLGEDLGKKKCSSYCSLLYLFYP